ncbi:MAG: hypothetical protein RIG84_19980 [Roseovarius sp.]
MQSPPSPPRIDPARLAGALEESPAFRSLPPDRQDELAQTMAKVFGYLGEAPARAMAPNLDVLRQGQGGGYGQGSGQGYGGQPGYGQGQPPAPPPGQPPAQPPGAGGGTVFNTAADATREMLGAIGFPDFVASLVQGTFRAIVDSSIQQMEAYSNLLAETAKTVDTFMQDNITEDMARDHLTDNYGDIFKKDISRGYPELQVATGGVGAGQMPSFLQDLGFDSPMDLDTRAVDEVVIPQTRKTLAEMRHQSLATMVMMGINRIVVSDGEINAKLIFNIDASQSSSLTFNDYKPTNWTLAGQLGSNAFGASGIVVNTTNVNAQSEVNMNAELTGEVRVRFRSDYFPLERFADSAAIQLINQHARVPDPRAKAAANGANGTTGAQAGASGAPGAPGAPQPLPPPAALPGQPPEGNGGNGQ